MARVISAGEESTPRSASTLAVRIMPAVQKPHWTAAWRMKASTAARWKAVPARPSMVSTCRPSMSQARKQHELTGAPSTSTVQVPQTSTSHDCFTPVSPSSSRRKSSSNSLAATVPAKGLPLTVAEMCSATGSPGLVFAHQAAPGHPVLVREPVLVFRSGQFSCDVVRDRHRIAERPGHELQLRGALQGERSQDSPADVLTHHQDPVVPQQDRAPGAESLC